VTGICKQSQRAGEDAADDLGDHEAAGQEGGEPDAAFVGRMVAMRVTMTGMVIMIVTAVIVRVSVGVLH
jgi:hypothetical protein